MPQPVELILVRHLGSRLVVPVFLVDPEGTLIYFNEPAEQILGRRLEEVGTMTFTEWTTVFSVRQGGRLLDIDQIPLVRALREGRPAHSVFDITGLDGTARLIEVTAFPIDGQGGTRLGAVALFWETTPA
jgi:PAS domain S-box-containing protein